MPSAQAALKRSIKLAIFRLAIGERRALDIAAIGNRKFAAVGIACRDPDRRMRLLAAASAPRWSRELPELAVMGIVALPDAFDGRDKLAHALAGAPGVETR